MGKRKNSITNTNTSHSDKDHASATVGPNKRLNYSFDDLINSTQFKEFEVLTSDNFWEDSNKSNELALNSDDRRLRFGDAASDPQIDKSNSLEFDGGCEVEVESADYHSIDFELITLQDFYKHDYPTCLIAKQMITERRKSITFSELLPALTNCIKSKRVEQARMVIMTVLNGKYRHSLTKDETESLLLTVIRISLDSRFDDLLFDLAKLCKNLLNDKVPHNIIKRCVEREAPVFSSFPYRAVSVGNFFRLFSHSLTRSFYDHLLCGQPIESFSDYLALELETDFEDRLKMTERLILAYSRLTVTDEKMSSSDLLRLIRRLKGRLPVALVGSIVDIQDVLTKMSCFLIANESKRKIV